MNPYQPSLDVPAHDPWQSLTSRRFRRKRIAIGTGGGLNLAFACVVWHYAAGYEASLNKIGVEISRGASLLLGRHGAIPATLLAATGAMAILAALAGKPFWVRFVAVLTMVTLLALAIAVGVLLLLPLNRSIHEIIGG